MRLLYIVYDGITHSVFDSQILRYLEGLKSRGVEVTLAAFDPCSDFRSDRYRDKRQRILDALEGRATFRFRLPVIGRQSVFPDALRLSGMMKRWANRKTGPGIVHCRSTWASYLAVTARKAVRQALPVIADIRGDAVAETRLYESTPLLTAWKTRELIRALRIIETKADHFFCVTKVLGRHMADVFGFRPDRVTVLPTCVKTDLFRYDRTLRLSGREKLDLSDRFVVVYSGGVQGWQGGNSLIDAFEAVRRSVSSAHFLVLTHGVEQMTALIRQAGIPESDCTVFRVDHGHMPAYLMCGDVGLMIREQNPVNRVASPTKFAEYLSAGLPVLSSPGIGDTEAIVEENRVGFIWDGSNALRPFLDAVMKEREAYAERCAATAERCYDLDAHLETVLNVYERVCAQYTDVVN